ncbi:acyltransferase family protein [Microbacterium timonense]|uniref:acyltransferase family protein n=1 Tax=Microbacterium timonense TaxID=2086576 RepID=UPI000D0FAAD3|nr:acyltransferase [Microbacterium timonense]
MTVVDAARAASPSRSRGRDRAIDLIRAVCIVGVVLLHAMMVGVEVTATGPAFLNASDGAWWIVPLSWALQVMPLFFVIGGFSGVTAFRRARARGGSAREFVAGRIHRLLLPAVVTIGAAGALLAMLSAAGVGADLVSLAGFRFAQPLWFLGVFLVCQALLPVLVRLHESAPLRSLGVLAGLALIVDVARIATGVDALGFINLAFVWLALQQVGFFLADGAIDALSRRTRAIAAAGATAMLALSFAGGIHSPDLVANINPPTTALLLVGVIHTALFSLYRAHVERLAQRRVPGALTAFVTPRAMTIYLWHMPVLLSLAGITAAAAMTSGMPLPPIDGPGWWIGRPLWLAVALLVTAVVARPLSRIEAVRAPAATRSVRRLIAATSVGAAAVALLLVAGTTAFTATAAVALLIAALRLARTPVRSSRVTASSLSRIAEGSPVRVGAAGGW